MTKEESANQHEADFDSGVTAAAAAVAQAREALRQAQEHYDEAYAAASAKQEHVHDASVGEFIDSTARCIRKFPLPSVIAAGVAGYLLGKLFRR